jgi:N-acetylglucosamine-6-phosphate deacetylase
VKDDVIAGSSLTMIRGIKNLVSFGFSIGDAVKCASANPAELMHYKNKGLLIPGYDADIAVFDKHFNVLLTVVNGHIKKNIL